MPAAVASGLTRFSLGDKIGIGPTSAGDDPICLDIIAIIILTKRAIAFI